MVELLQKEHVLDLGLLSGELGFDKLNRVGDSAGDEEMLL
jgi:hypothetical protein